MEARAGNSILDFETLFSDFQELLNGSGLSLEWMKLSFFRFRENSSTKFELCGFILFHCNSSLHHIAAAGSLIKLEKAVLPFVHSSNRQLRHLPPRRVTVLQAKVQSICAQLCASGWPKNGRRGAAWKHWRRVQQYHAEAGQSTINSLRPAVSVHY